MHQQQLMAQATRLLESLKLSEGPNSRSSRSHPIPRLLTGQAQCHPMYPSQQQQQQPQQQQGGFLSSTLQKLEHAARTAAPGLTQQVDKVLASVGLSSSAQQQQGYQPAPYAPWPGASHPGASYAPYSTAGSYPGGQHPYPAGPHQQQQAYYYHPHQPPVTQVYAPITQVYPPPGAYVAAAPPAYPASYPGAPYQPGQAGYQQQQAPPQQYQQQHHHQHQQQPQQQPEIPIIEATLDIKPSGLPVGSKPQAGQQPAAQAAAAASAVAGAAAVSATLQQQQGLQHQLRQLWASAVPVSAQGPVAASLAGSWYHGDAGTISELTLMSDGRCYWSKSTSSSMDSSSEPLGAAAAAADAYSGSAGSSSTQPLQQQQQQQQQGGTEVWHGVWRVQEGNTAAGKVGLVYIIELKPPRSQQQQQQLQQQQCTLTYQRSALEDTLVLNGLAHIKLGNA